METEKTKKRSRIYRFFRKLSLISPFFISIIAGLWTYTQYSDQARQNELLTLTAIGQSIAGMQITCNESFTKLDDTPLETENPKKTLCYNYLVKSRELAFSASITVHKPWYVSQNDWKKAWRDFYESLCDSTNHGYQDEKVSSAWNKILQITKTGNGI